MDLAVRCSCTQCQGRHYLKRLFNVLTCRMRRASVDDQRERTCARSIKMCPVRHIRRHVSPTLNGTELSSGRCVCFIVFHYFAISFNLLVRYSLQYEKNISLRKRYVVEIIPPPIEMES